MATVHIVSTPGLGRRFLLDSPETIIGRSRLAGIDLEGANVSRRHARIVCREGSFLLEDLGSSNGTFLNDQRLTSQAPLTQGDLIKIGGHILKFDGENAPPPTSPSTARRPPRPITRNSTPRTRPAGSKPCLS